MSSRETGCAVAGETSVAIAPGNETNHPPSPNEAISSKAGRSRLKAALAAGGFFDEYLLIGFH